jgi:ornithine cyclodeaminase
VKIINLPKIQEILNQISIEALVKNQESAFVSYSQGLAKIPPVGYLEFLNPPGDCHIKYGYTSDEDIFAIKIATGFYNNVGTGLPSGDGLILVFSSKTGLLKTILLDEGYLTNIRTALAGLIAAQYLAPKNICGIGIFGTGCQAKLQLQYLKAGLNIDCQNIWVWGRSINKLQTYRQEIEPLNLNIHLTTNVEEVMSNCNLIITTTASKKPIFGADMVQPGTHITAVGADSPGKQELDPQIFKQADLCIVDSISQCSEHGDISYAVKEHLIDKSKAVELGKVILSPSLGRTNEQQLTVADLTGIAAQDIKMATLIDNTCSQSQIDKSILTTSMLG